MASPPDRWLLLRAGGRVVAVPMAQVRGVDAVAVGSLPAAGEADTPRSLARLLGDSDAPKGRVAVRVGSGNGILRLSVDAVEEVVEGPVLQPLPPLLCGALGDDSPVMGAILWEGRPVLVVDLHQCAAGGFGQIPCEEPGM